MDIREITNRLQPSPSIASSGQPLAGQFGAIAAADYDVVINLAMPDSDGAIPDEGRIVTACGMSYVHIPVPFEAPGGDHLRRFLGVMTAFRDDRRWVHCVVNYRASAFLYLYWRRVLKATPEQARAVLLPSWEPDDVWRAFMGI